MNQKFDMPALLRMRRAQANMLQREVAERSIITRAAYGSYEEGRAMPDIFTLMRIAITFGFSSLDKFMDVTGDKETLPIVRAYYNATGEERKIVDRILKIKE